MKGLFDEETDAGFANTKEFCEAMDEAVLEGAKLLTELAEKHGLITVGVLASALGHHITLLLRDRPGQTTFQAELLKVNAMITGAFSTTAREFGVAPGEVEAALRQSIEALTGLLIEEESKP